MAKQKPVILPDYNTDTERAAIQTFNEQFFEQMDTSYIPGYTETVKANDIAATDDGTWYEQHKATGLKKEDVYKQIGANPRELPVRFMWLRVMDTNGIEGGAEVTKGLYDYKRRGYRPAVEADLTGNGFGFPPAAYKVGEAIRRDDLQLFVVDGRAASAYDRALADYTRNLENPETFAVDGEHVEVTTERRSETLTITQ